MKIDDVKQVGVVGAGQMGTGIAQVLATAGWVVLLVDVADAALDQALRRLRAGLDKAVEKGALSRNQAGGIMSLIRPITQLGRLRQADVVVEAVPEDLGMKTQVFAQLDRLCQPRTVLASNTSSIAITKLGSASGRADRVVGLHFMNPVPVMRLVEVVKGIETSDETVHLALDIVKRLGKTPVVCPDTPGFIVNRVLMPMINEAIFLFEEAGNRGLTPESIDLAMTEGTNQPVGPLALADRIGLDTVLAILNVLHEDLGDPKFRACPLLRKYVEAGWLGRKTGRGFYTYQA
jgi:3-hydroxybutyryl-CoA dehydrogenase